jgi:hypothetical protein
MRNLLLALSWMCGPYIYLDRVRPAFEVREVQASLLAAPMELGMISPCIWAVNPRNHDRRSIELGATDPLWRRVNAGSPGLSPDWSWRDKVSSGCPREISRSNRRFYYFAPYIMLSF